MSAAHATLAELFRTIDVHVTCANPHCWRSGGVLDGAAFIVRYGGDYPQAFSSSSSAAANAVQQAKPVSPTRSTRPPIC